MNTNQFLSVSCNHTTIGHVFYHVWCPSQSLLKRVTNIACGCVCLIGVILTAYLVTAHENSIEEYPPVGQEAIQFAMESLEKYPGIEPFLFESINPVTHQPTNDRIALLSNLFFEVYEPAFEEALKSSKENPWEQEEVLLAADEVMKVAYAMSCLTLEDLDPFIQKLKESGNLRTRAQALTEQDSYQYRTFYFCPFAYHQLRGGLVWDDSHQIFKYPADSVLKAHAQRFYKKGTRHNTWNQLYNDYCKRVRSYVKEKDLRRADKRPLNWTQQDKMGKEFDCIPDTQPT